ncbi:hypothetical protein N0M98_33390 [Paenibacillus doosanensis]|uniref:hypothetical protein n=1 Tax=Paenibacillus doosanensis TaxID=1229154 RepID=UPI0021809442|nr:hypothetical protein [Paenibacillus doosanensis]MCS7464979.1 hypothetical protein [Paenibacillus doosanensis]
MSKKWIGVGAGLTLGSALFVTSAFAGVGDAAGYDAYKAAIKATAGAHNVTEQMTLSVQDNGSKLLDVTSVVKADKTAQAASGSVNIKGNAAEETVSFYRQDGKSIVKAGSSDVYNMIGSDQEKANRWSKKDREAGADDFAKEKENLIDALVGPLKDYVTVEPQADGTKHIGFQLGASQVPAVVNAVSSFAVKAASSGQHADRQLSQQPFGTELAKLKDSFPKLTKDIRIEQVDMNADVDSQNRISGQKVQVTLSGKDDQGAAHEVVIDVQVGLSGFDATTPDRVDLTGKEVHTVDKASIGRHHGE